MAAANASSPPLSSARKPHYDCRAPTREMKIRRHRKARRKLQFMAVIGSRFAYALGIGGRANHGLTRRMIDWAGSHQRGGA